MYKRYTKRILDIVCVSLAMLVFCWLYALIAVLVRMKLGSPVIFRQQRPGLNEKVFWLYKYRTMTDSKDAHGELLCDDKRLTHFGRFLRSTSLDELPEAWNILKGDMSIIGPRPLLVEYLPFYSEMERHRHDVRPGITGLAQVNGRNALPWTERFELDVEYTRSVSFINDIRIISKTIKKVITKADILIGTQHVLRNLDEEREALLNTTPCDSNVSIIDRHTNA